MMNIGTESRPTESRPTESGPTESGPKETCECYICLTTDSSRPLLPQPCGRCNLWVHQDCLELHFQKQLTALTSVFSDMNVSPPSVCVFPRPGGKTTLCSQCTVCKNVFEYRCTQASEGFAKTMREACEARTHLPGSVMVELATLQLVCYGLSQLTEEGQQSVAAFAERAVRSLQHWDTNALQWKVHIALEILSMGLCVWLVCGVLRTYACGHMVYKMIIN